MIFFVFLYLCSRSIAMQSSESRFYPQGAGRLKTNRALCGNRGQAIKIWNKSPDALLGWIPLMARCEICTSCIQNTFSHMVVSTKYFVHFIRWSIGLGTIHAMMMMMVMWKMTLQSRRGDIWVLVVWLSRLAPCFAPTGDQNLLHPNRTPVTKSAPYQLEAKLTSYSAACCCSGLCTAGYMSTHTDKH